MSGIFLTYFTIGVTFSLWFSWIQLKKNDPMTSSTSPAFKLITMPAAMLLWPLLLYKLKQSHD